MEKIKVIQNGFGKMGAAVFKEIQSTEDIQVGAIVDPNSSIKDESDYKNLYKLAEKIGIYPTLNNVFQNFNHDDFDVLVDFSNSVGCLENCVYAADHGINIVSGTIPIPPEHESQITESILSNKVVGIRAENFSPEVNKFFYLMEEVAELSEKGASVSVLEEHRYEKLATAGTAAKIARILAQGMGKEGYILLREGKAFNAEGVEVQMPDFKSMSGIEVKKVLGEYIQVSCDRFSDEPGKHIVKIGNENDFMKYIVRSTRGSYGKGVVSAISFTDKQGEPGQYDFARDILGLK